MGNNLEQYLIPLLFVIAFISILIKGYLSKAIPIAIKVVGMGEKKEDTTTQKKKKAGFQRFREKAGIALSYIVIFIALMHIPPINKVLTYKWLLTVIGIIVMISIDMLTGTTEESWEKSGKRKKARFHLQATLIVLLIYIGYSAFGVVFEKGNPFIAEANVKKAKASAWQKPVCADGSYDLSRAKTNRKVVVNFRSDCLSKVTLPPNVTYRTRPSADYKIRFIDGAEFIGGPGRQVWLGERKALFQIIGVSSGGTLEIFMEKI